MRKSIRVFLVNQDYKSTMCLLLGDKLPLCSWEPIIAIEVTKKTTWKVFMSLEKVCKIDPKVFSS